ncbi:hypothetical protein [Streptomyces sp. S465]|uniref:hypothetical protein n=1 Tax=Streptomyces sp. S465 TaxID=2979468 RepID=UPI0022A814C9|nr:hypothetical protein [Streptomyces sp. S465]WAP55146.1 hypothetical protein N6H00_09210 [Streptomyces sp. S465]
MRATRATLVGLIAAMTFASTAGAAHEYRTTAITGHPSARHVLASGEGPAVAPLSGEGPAFAAA